MSAEVEKLRDDLAFAMQGNRMPDAETVVMTTQATVRGVLSGVRLSRLPGCYREGKYDDQDRYTRFPRPKLQKLLYVRPAADGRPLCEMPARRDVEALWCAQGMLGVDGHLEEAALAKARRGLSYYANVSTSCAAVLRDLEGNSAVSHAGRTEPV